MGLLSFFPLIMLESGTSAMIRPGPFEIGLVTVGLIGLIGLIVISVIVYVVVRLTRRSPGRSKNDKYERDLKLLVKGLDEEPDNSRYMREIFPFTYSS